MSATKQSEREKQLEAERDDYKAKYEATVGERDTVTTERNDYKAQYEGYLAKYEEALAPVVPLFYDPYEALNDEDFATTLEIVLAVAHDRGIVTTPEETEATTTEASPEAQAEPTQEQEIKALLVRYGLKEAFIMPDGSACFDKEHAQRFMGADFDSLTVISAE